MSYQDLIAFSIFISDQILKNILPKLLATSFIIKVCRK